MFDQSSRYYTMETTTHTTRDGHTLAYKRRRFLPRGEGMPLLGEISVAQGDRLDLIAARTLGDPLHFWRICDANNAMNPSKLTEEPGAILLIPVPQP
jgi:hypothetical protein